MYFDRTNENQIGWSPYFMGFTPTTNKINHTPLTSSSNNIFSPFQKPITSLTKNSSMEIPEEDHTYLLLKSLPKDMKLEDLEELFKDKKTYERVITIPNSKNIYIKFGDMEEAKILLEEDVSVKKLELCLVKKLPLDLNNTSRIVLITVYNEKVEVNVYSIYEIFKEFGEIKKIIIFKKKNFQVFIEFAKTEEAFIFKKVLHNQNHKGYFFLKIQFTRKKNLKVNHNNLYEFDFTVTKKKPVYPHTTNFDLHQNQNAINIDESVLNQNIVTSLNNFDDFDLLPKTEKKTIKEKFVLKIPDIKNEIKHKTFFNLFSLYGKIAQISINEQNNSVYIFFLNSFDQNRSFRYLNNIPFYGSILKIELLKSGIKSLEDFFSYVELQQISSKTYSAKESKFNLFNKSESINKPNQTLYLSNLNEILHLQMITNMFENFEKVQDKYYLDKKKSSALVVFLNVEAAIKILSIFKNMEFMDRELKINFASEEMIKNNFKENEKKMKFSTFADIDQLDQIIDLDKLIMSTPSQNKNTTSNFQLFAKSKFNF